MASRVLFSVMATVLGVVCRGPGSCHLAPASRGQGARLSAVAALAFILGLPSASADPQSDPQAGPRAVIELFTSQGCSACPAADKLMSELQSVPSFIPLTLAIDYWDILGWKDTLALPGHTRRQRAYAQMRGDRDIYTPQAVVNGVAQAIGSDLKEIEGAVAQSYVNNAPLSVPVKVTIADGNIAVTVPARDNDPASEIWLCPVSGQVSVDIARGENRGHTMTYTNVVRRWIKLGAWDGRSETTVTVPVDAVKGEGVDAFAVLVQSGTSKQPGAIVGASLTPLKSAVP